VKTNSILLSALTAGSLLLTRSALGGEPATPATALEIRCAQARATVTAARLIEVPDKAARVVWSAPARDRGVVARQAVEAALTRHPTAVYATVKAVLTVAPEHVAPVMDAVIAATPNSIRTALRAVSEVSEDSLVAAVQVVGVKAPAQAQMAQSFAARRLGTAKLAALPWGSGSPSIVIQQVTVVTTPPIQRISNNYVY